MPPVAAARPLPLPRERSARLPAVPAATAVLSVWLVTSLPAEGARFICADRAASVPLGSLCAELVSANFVIKLLRRSASCFP